MAYEKELLIAQLAVQRAVILTSVVFNSKVRGTVNKSDRSPVTIGDFGAQALIISALKANFPQDEIVAEEESSKLAENETLRKQVWDLVREVKLDDDASEEALGGAVKTEEDMLKLIDMGKSNGGAKGRIWAIDPIDGTKGFLRGGQYAVCLALIVDGDVKVGVLGCPNLPVEDSAPMTADVSSDSGVLFAASQGQGSISRTITTGALSPARSISMRPLTDISKAAFCESVESGHSAHDEQAIISQRLGITAPSVRMDSQAKYASIARGAGDIYLRLPTSKTYEEKIWDHASGCLIVKEAGGVVTDANGKELDFGIGKTLKANKGVVGAPRNVQAEVLKVVQAVLAERAS